MPTITFDNIQSGDQAGPTYTYTEAGFTFGPTAGYPSRVFGITSDANGVAYTSNALTYSGSTSGFIGGQVSAADGSAFTPNSIQINQLYLSGQARSVRFYAVQNGTNTGFQDVSFDGDPSTVQTVSFAPGIFTNITALQYTFLDGSSQPQFDNFVVNPVCFDTGTLIRTARGEVAVEALRVGDRAVTASGALRPIRWIGHRHLDGAGCMLAHDQQPIRVRKGAFGPGLPARNLYLSPGHPVLVGSGADGEGGVLVPIMCLINGTSIRREPRGSVTYWHIELDSHDILLAEGLAAESYLDWGDRPFFDEASDHALHNPDFVVPGLGNRCRLVAVDGPLVEAERTRLDAVFATELAAHSAWGETDALAWLAA